MSLAIRAGVLMLLALLAWPELARYGAERNLGQVNASLDRLLRGQAQGAAGVRLAEQSYAAAVAAAAALPGDSRPPLLQSVALILLGRGDDAVRVLRAAIDQGERPELTINLGRAYTLLGNTAAADAAYLRTAWASPSGIATLPKAMRETLLAQVQQREAELRAGRLAAPPALP